MYMQTQVDNEKREVRLHVYTLHETLLIDRVIWNQVVCLYKLIPGRAESSYGTRMSTLNMPFGSLLSSNERQSLAQMSLISLVSR